MTNETDEFRNTRNAIYDMLGLATFLRLEEDPYSLASIGRKWSQNCLTALTLGLWK